MAIVSVAQVGRVRPRFDHGADAHLDVRDGEVCAPRNENAAFKSKFSSFSPNVPVDSHDVIVYLATAYNINGE